MKNLLIIAGMLFFSFFSFSTTNNIFPTPKGFTTDKSKALKIHVHISPSIEKEIKQDRAMGQFINGLMFCRSISTKTLSTTINGKQHMFGAVTASTQYSNGQYSLLCRFGWAKTKYPSYISSKYLNKESPEYYILKQ